jgi:bacillithiol biosynthesis deacetylase BshB1
MKLDLLAFAAHPDDVELSCSGTLMVHIAAGQKVGIVDLTRGELGTRGSAALREKEAAAAADIMGIHYRHNLGLRDGFFEKNEDSLIAVIEQIRLCKPAIVLANAISDRHIDHGRAANLVAEACFLSGLTKISTHWQGKPQEAWRPKAVYHYIQDRHLKPDIVVDITPYFNQKMKAVMAFSSQFYVPGETGPVTPISTPDFVNFLEARAREMGRNIQVTYAEGFTVQRTPGVRNLMDLL